LKPAQYRWLLDAEAKQRQKRGYRAMPLEMTERWQEEKATAANGDRGAGLAVFRADMGRDPAAGMLFLIHGRRATYHVGWTSEAGRDNAAHNLILWAAIKDLKARGVAVLDLGGVNTQSGAGIARFKLETGGAVLQRAGAYV
jgi:lipid II:glycine glycyltransferase (peptidoglycan interpeptide bridge formation enzyme)